MQGERAALFATDPPYLVDYNGTNHPTKKNVSARARKIANKDWSEEYIEQRHWDDSSQGPQFYEAFMQVAIDCAIKEDAAWYCWHASRRQAMLEACWSKFDVLHHQQIIWAKSRPVLTRSIMLWAHEPCLFGWRSGNKPRVNREGFENWPTTVWSIPSSEIETREHPTSKPVRVFTLPMELHTVPGEICYALSDQVKRRGKAVSDKVKRRGKADGENSKGHFTVETNGRRPSPRRLPRPDGLDGQRWRVAHNPTGPAAATGVVVSAVR